MMMWGSIVKLIIFGTDVKKATPTADYQSGPVKSKKYADGACYFFLRHAPRPMTPRPVPRRRSEAGSGMEFTSLN